jgi:hypothetical protein
MKDLHSAIHVVPVAIAALSADNTPVAIDLQGYNSAEILLCVGIGGVAFSGTNKIEFKLTHADDKADGSSPDNNGFSAVGIDDVLGVQAVGEGGIIKDLTSEHAAAAVYRIGYKGNKRWLKLLADFSGTHGTATPLSLLVVRGGGYANPQPDQN